jgi:hypothetical protein
MAISSELGKKSVRTALCTSSSAAAAAAALASTFLNDRQ